MMNVIQIQDALKGMPMEQLIREMQMPSGQAPQFLVLGEIARRKQMEKEFAQRQGQPQTTVAEDAVTAAGVPQQGIASAARAMAPQTDMAMNTAPTQQAPVQGMADGGYVQKMQAGGIADRERAARRLAGQITPRVGTLTTDPRILQLANAFGVTVAEAIRMVEDNPQLLAATETPSAMVTSPGISRVEGGAEAGYNPASMTARDILAASAGEYDPTLSRVSSDTSMFLPAAPPRPVGGSLVTPPPFLPPDRFDPTALPEGMEREMARAAAGEEALRSRVGMSTVGAAQDADERERLMARAGLISLLDTQSQAARAAAGREAGASRVGMSTADAARQASEAKRIREAMDLFTAENLFQKTDNQPGEATTRTGRNIVSLMPGAGAAPTMPGAPDQPGLPAILAAIGGGAPQEAPRRPVGAQNLPLLAGLGDTMRGQEGAAAAFDAMRAEQLRRQEEADAALARRDVLPFTSAFDPVVSAYSGEEGQYPGDPTRIMPEAPLPEEAVGTLRPDLTVERPAYDLFRGEGIGATLRRAIDRANAAYARSKRAGAAGGAEAVPPAPEAVPPAPEVVSPAPEVVPAPASTTTGGIAAAMSPFETELTSLLQQREKRAEQDKWLALAQVGMSLMGSRQPTFAGALGEAGAAGLQQFQQGRAQYDKDRLELMALLENTRLARAKLAAASAPKARLLPDEVLTAFDDEIEATRAALSNPYPPPTPAEKMRLTAQLNNLLTEKANARGAFFAQYGYAMPPAAPAASGVYSTDDVRS